MAKLKLVGTGQLGPVYGLELIDTLPIGGGMLQQMAGSGDLIKTEKVSTRTAAAYEVMLHHLRKQVAENERLRGLIQAVIDGNWSVTGLQEAIGELDRT